jgi:hypothetical protein
VLHFQPILFFMISVQIMKLFSMRFSSDTCYLVPFRPKYLPQHPILEHPQPTLLKNPSHIKYKFYRR